MYYPQEVVDEVLANTDIVDVVSAHVHLKKKGKDYVGLCPFHSEKTPSFNVIPGKGIYYCFGCGAGGTAITFLMKYNNSTFLEALQELADRAQITLPQPDRSEASRRREQHRQELLAVNKDAAVYFYRLLRAPKGNRGMRYFTDRGLSPETMKMFGLGFADGARSDLTAYLQKKGYPDELILESDVAAFNEKQGIHDRFWNRVMFPIQDVRGRVIGFGGRVLGDGKPKYINSSDTQIFDKGRNLYALNLARRTKKEYMILCEGYMDVIAMHQAGFIEAVASLGTAFTPGQAALLRRYVRKVLLAYDSDAAGVRAALRNIGILRAGGLDCSVIDLRPHKDPDEFIKAEGKEAFRERIDGAENGFFYELRILSQSYRMDDPAQRTAFHREIAKKLCTFSDEIERENYILGTAEKYFIKADALRRLVARYGEATGYGSEAQKTSRENRPSYSGYTGGTAQAGERTGSGKPRIIDTGNRTQAGELTDRSRQANTGTKNTGRENTEEGQRSADRGGIPAAGTVPAGAGAGSAARSGNGRPAARAPSRPSRAQLALWRKQRILLTWISEEPEIFSQVRKYLCPEDFDGPVFRQTARLVWEQLSDGRGVCSPASIISSFETGEEQEAAAAMFSTRLEEAEESDGTGRAGRDPENVYNRDREAEQTSGRDRDKSLREILIAIKDASLKRMTQPQGGSAVSLQEVFLAKQQLQALRSAKNIQQHSRQTYRRKHNT